MPQRIQPPRLPLTEQGTPADVRGQAGAYRAGPFSALGHHFTIELADGAVAGYLERALASLASPEADAVPWCVLDRGAPGGAGRFRFGVFRDRERLFGCDGPDEVVALLLWWINRTVCFETHHRLMVHAAVAAVDGRAVVMPGPQESGKTTLVAALVADGFGYLTDEAAAFEPATGAIEAYPKWLSMKAGSWPLFAHLRPELAPALAPFATAQWHLDPEAIRPGAVVPAAEPAWLIAPRYQPGAATALEPMTRAEALATLAGEAFNLARVGQDGFSTLAGVVRRSRCWRLTTGDLAGAVAAVRSVTG